MQDDVRANSSPLPSGGIIHLQARAADLGSLLGPTWATLCGVLASNAFHWERGDYVKLPLLLLLVDGGWGTIWAALAGTDWSIPVQLWRDWEKNRPAVSLPYTLPGTVGDRLSRWMRRIEAWWRSILWPTCGLAVLAADEASAGSRGLSDSAFSASVDVEECMERAIRAGLAYASSVRVCRELFGFMDRLGLEICEAPEKP